jgi:membrane protease YdiL (CAAX protease family)
MNFLSHLSQPPGLILVAFINLLAGMILWGVLVERWFTGNPLIVRQPRRLVPWEIWDLLAIVLFHYTGLVAFFVLLQNVIFPDSINPDTVTAAGKISKEHLLGQLLASNSWTALVVGVGIGVIVVPIIEEMFFRVFLQGWMEKVERNMRRRLPVLRQLTPLAVMPIFFSSLLFASAHFREAGPSPDARQLVWLFIGQGIVSLITLLFAILWVHFRVGATAEDLGWAPKKFLSDLRLGLIAFLTIVVPLFSIQISFGQLLPEKFAPDPITIFFFAIPLGLFYYRSHRAMPSIALHAALNATSLTLLLLGLARS